MPHSPSITPSAASAGELLAPSRERWSSFLSRLTPPEDFFTGISLKEGITPDNILFFTRTHTEAFLPDDASSNTHHRFELLILFQKAGPVHIGETSFHLHPGDAALIFPHQFHHYMDVEPGEIEWLFITFELPDQITTLAPLRDSPRRLGPVEFRLLEQVLQAHACLAEAPETAPLAISYHLGLLLAKLLDAPPIPTESITTNPAHSTRDAVLEKISRYVHSHLSETLTLDTIANAIGYSESHLRAVFKNQLGLSLGRYIRESRLIEATRLLKNGETNMSDVARRTGFESPFAFSRAFKKAYGIPPKSYSKRFQA